MIPWLRRGEPFPPAAAALEAPNGLLAASFELDVAMVREAYRQGIFPWYSAPEPVLWWSPDPRMVLRTDALRLHRSLRKRLRALLAEPGFEVRIDVDFAATMRACAAPRPGQEGTWITRAIVTAYGELHRRGEAHSVEVFRDGTRIGGLYGVALGRMFFGESMFSRAPDASKIALVALVSLLRAEAVPVIDCQQHTQHLASLGARTISRADFCAHVEQAVEKTPIDWTRYLGRSLNELLID